ncbi:MAG: aminodeoxychorismate lyase [Gammaproteobacteria bacterium]
MSDWLIDGIPAGSLPVTDRGFQYGDGLFETVAVRAGEPRFLDRHLQRLESGMKRLGIAPVSGLTAAAAAEVRRLALECGSGAAKVIVTRGTGPRGYRLPPMPAPMRLVGVMPAGRLPRENYEQGIALRVCRTPVGWNPVLAGMKTLGRLEQVLARAEWNDPGIAEGLMLDREQRIVGGTMTNFFVVSGGRLCTPSLAGAGVAGIMRGLVLEQAEAAGLEFRERDMTVDGLRDDDELFVTNSQVGIWPVCRVDERPFVPGAWTRRLMARLTAIGVEECAC